MTAFAYRPEAADGRWAHVRSRAPMLASTCQFYLDQIAVTLRPASVVAAETCLRLFAEWLVDNDPSVRSLRQLTRSHVQDYKRHLATRDNGHGTPLKKTTINLWLSVLRVTIERLIERDHPDAPIRNPIFGTDLPKIDEPLPKFLDDTDATKFMQAATRLDPLRRLVVEMLALTGMSVGEFCALRSDAVVCVGDTHWLRVPSANFTPTATSRSTRSCSSSSQHGGPKPDPMTPACSSPTTAIPRPIRHHRHDEPLRSRSWHRARPPAPTPPHLATQAINGGMSLEAIATMLDTNPCA